MFYLAALLRFRDILSYLLVCLFIRVIKCLQTLSRPRENALSQSGVLETRQNTANNSQVCSLQMTSEIGSRELTSSWLTVSTTPTWWSTPYSRSVHAWFLLRSLWLCEWLLFSLVTFFKASLVLHSGVWCLQGQAAGVQQQSQPTCPGVPPENHQHVEKRYVSSGQHPVPGNCRQSPQFKEQCHLFCCSWGY